MKKSLLTLAACALALAFVQCGTTDKSAYTVKVNMPDLPGTAVAYMNYNVNDENVTDTASLVGGSFEFKGTAAEPFRANLTINRENAADFRPGRDNRLMFYVEPGTIEVNATEKLSEATVTGSALNDEKRAWETTMKPINDEQSKLYEWVRGLTEEERNAEGVMEKFRADNDVLSKRGQQMAYDYIKSHPNSFFALSELYKSATGYSPEVAKAEEVLGMFSPELLRTQRGQSFTRELEAWKATQIGEVAPDFTQNDPDGNPIKLSDLRGQYVLLDFWASWCGPCRAENPHVVAAYNKYKERGFTVFGVSLDTDRDKWLEAIEKDQLAWQQVSDLQGWQNAASKMYGVSGIPANYLLDPEGVIVATDLRGDKLEEALEKYLGTK